MRTDPSHPSVAGSNWYSYAPKPEQDKGSKTWKIKPQKNHNLCQYAARQKCNSCRNATRQQRWKCNKWLHKVPKNGTELKNGSRMTLINLLGKKQHEMRR